MGPLQIAFLTLIALIPRHLGAPACCAAPGSIGTPVKIATGFVFTEGPVVDHQDHLYFTDLRDRGGKIYRRDPAGKIDLLVACSGRANGLAINPHGELVACQAIGRIVAYSLDGQSCRVLADGYHGRRFNAPNDLVIDKDGGIYFTDPLLEARRLFPPQGKAAVYYLAPDGAVTRLIEGLDNPNGIGLSPDQQTLYVVQSTDRAVMAYPIMAPGVLGRGRVFCRVRRDWVPLYVGGDGLEVDAAGNLYIASHRGVQIFDPCGRLARILSLPEHPSNLAFSRDGATLYITAQHSIYAAPVCPAGCAPFTWVDAVSAPTGRR
jgi:gluconolactonase